MAYKITDEERLAEMLDLEPEKVLEEQFLIPKATQTNIDSTPSSLFKLLNT